MQSLARQGACTCAIRSLVRLQTFPLLLLKCTPTVLDASKQVTGLTGLLPKLLLQQMWTQLARSHAGKAYCNQLSTGPLLALSETQRSPVRSNSCLISSYEASSAAFMMLFLATFGPRPVHSARRPSCLHIHPLTFALVEIWELFYNQAGYFEAYARELTGLPSHRFHTRVCKAASHCAWLLRLLVNKALDLP